MMPLWDNEEHYTILGFLYSVRNQQAIHHNMKQKHVLMLNLGIKKHRDIYSYSFSQHINTMTQCNPIAMGTSSRLPFEHLRQGNPLLTAIKKLVQMQSNLYKNCNNSYIWVDVPKQTKPLHFDIERICNKQPGCTT